MKNKFFKILDLWEKYQKDELQEEEKSEFDNIFLDPAMMQVKEDILGKKKIKELLEQQLSFNNSEAYSDFIKKIKIRRSLQRRTYLAIAAVIILLISIYFFIPKANTDKGFKHFANNEIISQNRTGTILLSNGETIVLDTIKKEKYISSIRITKDSITYQNPNTSINTLEYNILNVPQEGECKIILSDNTEVWINSESSLKYPVRFIGDERHVYLEGEAYFKVSKNSKPFIVSTYLGDIKVFGTSFNIKAYKNEERVLTTLVEGSVGFYGKKIVKLKPGEQCVAQETSIPFVHKVDINNFIGWREGEYQFSNNSLLYIMNDLVRWYGVNITFLNEDLKNIEFTGKLKRYNSINTFLELLKRTGSINYRISGKNIYIFK